MASVLSATNAAAQNLATRPEMQMQSTSVMVGSGSTLPQAASTGTYVTGSTPGSYSPTSVAGPRRAKKDDDDWEGDDPTYDDEPWKTPLGDAMITLALLAVAYALARVYRRKRA